MHWRREARKRCEELLEPLMVLLRHLNKNPSIEMWDGYRYLAIYFDKLSKAEYDLVNLAIRGINNEPWGKGTIDVDCHGDVIKNPFIDDENKREFLSFSFTFKDDYYYFLGGKEVLDEEIKEVNNSIMELENELEVAKAKRHKLHIGFCENVTNHRARARVLNHTFTDEHCPRNGDVTFEVEVYDMYTKEVLFRDRFSDYYEMPLLSGDPNTEYCCGVFQLNREVIAWHLYKRRDKTSCEYYRAITWGIEKYIHDNHLGCGMCE